MALNQVGLERLNTATTKKIGTSKNLIINGSMLVAQRGTSSTSAGYQTVDRIKVGLGGNDESPTLSQVDVASGTTPYTSGFRKALKITNGNQTGGAGAGDTIEFHTRLEGQDVANSGWNYKSTSSFVTLSFWIKSSVAQTFPGYLHTQSNPEYIFPFETGSLVADTWTKITKTIPGNSNLVFDNDNGFGLKLAVTAFRGTDYTDNSVTYDAWAAYSSSTRSKDQTTTWYTTNNATLECTGIQLEVGSVATDFEHRSFAEELLLCQRYYYRTTPSNQGFYGVGNIDGGSQGQILIHFPTEMRSKPTSLETTGTATDYILRVTTNVNCTGVPTIDNTSTTTALVVPPSSSHGLTDKSGAFLRAGSDSSFLGFAGAEL